MDSTSSALTRSTYPEGEEGVVDLGNRHFLQPFGERGWLWWHDCPKVRSWSWFGQLVDGRVSGHQIASREPLTVTGSLLCPQGCGDHGFIESGHWRVA